MATAEDGHQGIITVLPRFKQRLDMRAKGCRRHDPTEYQQKKEQLLVRLKRMLPGSTTCLGALEDPASKAVTTDPRNMARLLTEHWGRTLTAKPVDQRLLSAWLRDVQDRLPPASDTCWSLTPSHIGESLRRCHASSPGSRWDSICRLPEVGQLCGFLLTRCCRGGASNTFSGGVSRACILTIIARTVEILWTCVTRSPGHIFAHRTRDRTRAIDQGSCSST